MTANEKSVLTMCEGCKKLGGDGECTVYSAPPSFYVRNGECGLNRKLKEESAKQKKIRVGQQKQRNI